MPETSTFDNGLLNVTLRTVTDRDGVRFVLADVAKILGYRDAANAVHLLRPVQISVADKETMTRLGVRGRSPMLVTESGFYRLCLRSSRHEAEPFQNWVEDEVLPAIKRDGGYLDPKRTGWQNARLGERIQYRELRDIVAASADYDPSDKETRQLFAQVQNMFHVAITGSTAKQLKASRDIVRWTGVKGPTQADADVAKNYLTEDELTVYTGLGSLVLARMKLTWPKGGHDMGVVHLAVREALEFALSVGATLSGPADA